MSEEAYDTCFDAVDEETSITRHYRWSERLQYTFDLEIFQTEEFIVHWLWGDKVSRFNFVWPGGRVTVTQRLVNNESTYEVNGRNADIVEARLRGWI